MVGFKTAKKPCWTFLLKNALNHFLTKHRFKKKKIYRFAALFKPFRPSNLQTIQTLNDKSNPKQARSRCNRNSSSFEETFKKVHKLREFRLRNLAYLQENLKAKRKLRKEFKNFAAQLEKIMVF